MIETPTGKNSKQPTLSFSRMSEFQQCPLKYRLSMVDRIEQEPQLHLAFGTAVHQVLENLYREIPPSRTIKFALDNINDAWDKTLNEHPEYLPLFQNEEDVTRLKERIHQAIEKYFQIERPCALTNGGCEVEVEAITDENVAIRGFIDRVDINPSNGALRIVDYKTGKVPAPRFQEKALKQLRYYSYLLYKQKNLLPARTQLVYIEHRQVLTLDPGKNDLLSIEEEINTTWTQMEDSLKNQYFQPRKTRLCDWCSYQKLCPIFGGKLPPFPAERASYLLKTRVGSA
ncbi:PD-(D/E)XK nuclease family protein [Actinomycetaceae bacterium TAE3-ERU4]|nr:PD-(D/E)XK nuclease family protein [Actinomycetaceae bacterium TAE3-ERU4]